MRRDLTLTGSDGRGVLDSGAGIERLFFGLWPDAGAAGALHALARSQVERTGGRITAADSIHLTLVFIGHVPAAHVDALRAPAQGVAGPPFEFRLDRIGHWVRNGIAWAAPSVVPSAMAGLQFRLSAWVSAQGVTIDTRSFRPHVTLLRKAARSVSLDPIEPITWHVREYVLVRSRFAPDGSRYEIIGRFPLNRDAGTSS